MHNRPERDRINPIIAYVRGEPLDRVDRARLERSRTGRERPSLRATMEQVDEQLALSADLAALRRSIADLEPSPALRDTLGRQVRSHPDTGRRVLAGGWLRVAAAVAVAIGLIVWGASRIEHRGTPAIADLDPASTEFKGFIPVRYAGNPGAPRTYTVVRARLGRMGLISAGLILPTADWSEFVDADLLLDVDGTVIGIRFVAHHTRQAGVPAGETLSEDSI